MVLTASCDEPGTATVAGENVPPAPASESETVPVKPASGLTETVKRPLVPWLTLAEQRATGKAGAAVVNSQVDKTRTITVEFDANARGPWDFKPAVRSLQVLTPRGVLQHDWSTPNDDWAGTVRREFAAAVATGTPHPCDVRRGVQLERVLAQLARGGGVRSLHR